MNRTFKVMKAFKNNKVAESHFAASTGYGYGGAIYNNTSAQITISDSVLQNNRLSSSLTDGEGGALYNAGTITLNNTVLKQTILNSRLQQLPNVIVTPHIAYNTHEAVFRILDITMQNINAFESGTIQNKVN